VEDFSRDRGNPVYDVKQAAARVEAAVAAASAAGRLVITARAENYLYGRADLADTIARLQAYQEAGADVLYAPGLSRIEDIRELVRSVDRPVNVLTWPKGPPVAELAQAGVSRVSVGGAFAFAALGAVVEAARELQEQGTYGFLPRARQGLSAARAAFGNHT
jgi:2-methylisocitrate lyase-like PEP mutase family enzyme